MRLTAVALVGGMICIALAEAQQPTLDRAQQEQFLLQGEIISREPVGTGITDSVRVELLHEGIAHSAHLQVVDVERTGGSTGTDFRDSFRSNVAAYRLDQLLGQDLVPTSVLRQVDGKPAALTWWVDDVQLLERDRYIKGTAPPDVAAWNDQISQAVFFNNLIYNTDGNLANLAIDVRWRLWMLDFTRAFQGRADLRRPNALDRVDATVYEKLKSITQQQLADSLEELIGGLALQALLVRRDKIVTLVEARIAEQGREKVLFDLQARREALAALR